MAQNKIARLTPLGTGAIATLGLKGPDALPLLAELFQPMGSRSFQLDDKSSVGSFWFGRLGQEKSRGQDHVVVALRHQDDQQQYLEIHCHGGRQVIAMLEETFAARGVEVCSGTELWQNHIHRDISAAMVLSQTTTLRTANIVLDQVHGAFDHVRHEIISKLQSQQSEDAQTLLQELVRWIPLGKHLTQPWRVAIAGVPNVGKSSLINRLAGYQRAIVSEIPGTTRDIVGLRIALDGWPIELLDTAGVRSNAEVLEQEGIALAMAVAKSADLCLWLVDATAEPIWPEEKLPNMLFVVNKIDLDPAWEFNSENCFPISAQTGTGIAELCDRMVQELIPDVPPPGTAVPYTLAQCQRLQLAWENGKEGNWQEVLRLLQEM